MTLLQQIHTGRRHSPPRVAIYGIEGVGKSTVASQAPNPIFIPTEDGLDQIDCASFPLAKSFSDVTDALQALITEKHDFATVVIDSLDWLERLVWDVLCEQYGVSSIEKVDGGCECKDRKVWDRLCLNHSSEKTVKIARANLSAICRAAGVMQPRDSFELHNLPLLITVKCKKRENSDEVDNEVRGYAKRETVTGKPQQQEARSDNAPPWKR